MYLTSYYFLYCLIFFVISFFFSAVIDVYMEVGGPVTVAVVQFSDIAA